MTCSNCGKENPDDARFCMACASPLEAAGPVREVRKTVTVVFTDVTGSTELGERLDPESLRRVMAGYFDEVRTVLERHGGTVEKFIGDAVMAVFGIPRVHEDDALRAVRAAWDMRSALAALNDRLRSDLGVTIQTRTGVNTGEVVAGDATAGQALVTGDAVNVAARFEQAAAPGEILIGAATHRLVRDAVAAEPTDALRLKGKSDPVVAFRLLGVTAEAPGTARRLEAPMVGRDRELSLLQWAFDRAVDERTCHLATILGAAGVGKSRLAEEFLRTLDGRARVLRGRCLPYGDGITFWAVVETLHQAAGITDLDSSAEARRKVAAVVEGEEQAERIAERAAQVMGLVSNHAVPEETLWAIRKLFESLARSEPLVLVFDDIHWAEPTFLDLIEHIADWSREAPILLLCLARHELLDVRPAWGGGKMNATAISLEPLSEQQSGELVRNLLGRAELPEVAARRIADAAEGNPLFVEEMVGMLIDDGLLRRENGHWVPTGDLSKLSVPPTIQALLAARLDRLAGGERQVIERASVVGRTFYRGAVTELAPDPLKPEVADRLLTLTRRELIRPQPSEFAGEDTYRFRHILIRDSAYEAMPKEIRADLHERFAVWLERAAGDRVREFEEILAYHLEQSFGYRTELGLGDHRLGDVGLRAGRLLASAGRRAEARGDQRGAANLLSRAAALLPPEDPERVGVLEPLARSLEELGELSESRRVAEELAKAADRAGDRAAALKARQRIVMNRAFTDASLASLEGVRTEQAAVLADAEELGDPEVLFEARLATGTVLMWSGNNALALAQYDAAERLLRPDDPRRLLCTKRRAAPSIEGPLPVEQGVATWEAAVEASRGTSAAASANEALGMFLGMAGRIAECVDLLWTSHRQHEEFGNVMAVLGCHRLGRGLLLAGRPGEAIDPLSSGLDGFLALGEKAYAPTNAYILADALLQDGRHAEAEEFAVLARDLAVTDDYDAQQGWRRVLARVLTKAGRIDEAVSLAREAIEILEPTDTLNDRGESRYALAEALLAGGRSDEAADAARGALAEFERKGNVPMAARVRDLLSSLGA